MKKIKMFVLSGCPYCAQANRTLDQLKQENPEYARIPIEQVEEQSHPEIAAAYDYIYEPCMFMDGERVYESHPGESEQEAYQKIKAVLDKALA